MQQIEEERATVRDRDERQIPVPRYRLCVLLKEWKELGP